jgi:fermentation-respiration switch protein FrsA (DUF1100 family)
MIDTAAKLYPWLPVRLVMRNRYDSLARIAAYDGPVLQSHGTHDELIDYPHAQELFEAVRHQGKQWHDIAGGYHSTPQPPEYYDVLRKFLGQAVSNE